MANYSALIATINQYIKANGSGAITGQILNNVLNGMVSALGANYAYGGIVTPATTPTTPTSNVFYFATLAGSYSHFGNGFTFKAGVSILAWDGTQWSGAQLISFDDNEAATAGKGVFETRNALNSAYPTPKVGWYAYVGTSMPLKLYQCATENVWSDSGLTTSIVDGVMIMTVTQAQFEVMEDFIPNVLYVVV